MDVMLLGYLYMKAELKTNKTYNIFCGYKLYDVSMPFGSGKNAVFNVTTEEVEGENTTYNILNAKRVITDGQNAPKYRPVDCDVLDMPRYNITGPDSYNLLKASIQSDASTVVTILGNKATVIDAVGNSHICTGNEVVAAVQHGLKCTNFKVENNNVKCGYVYRITTNHAFNTEKDAKYYATIRCVEQFKLLGVYKNLIVKSGNELSDRYELGYNTKFETIRTTGTLLQQNKAVSPEIIATLTSINTGYLNSLANTLSNIFKEQEVKPQVVSNKSEEIAENPSVKPKPVEVTKPVVENKSESPVNTINKPDKDLVSTDEVKSVVPTEETKSDVSTEENKSAVPTEETKSDVPTDVNINDIEDNPAEQSVSGISVEGISTPDMIDLSNITFDGVGVDTSNIVTEETDNSSEEISTEEPVKASDEVPAIKEEPVSEVKEEPVSEIKEEPVSEVQEKETNLNEITSKITGLDGIEPFEVDNSGFVKDKDIIPFADSANVNYTCDPVFSYLSTIQGVVVPISRDSNLNKNFRNIPGADFDEKCKFIEKFKREINCLELKSPVNEALLYSKYMSSDTVCVLDKIYDDVCIEMFNFADSTDVSNASLCRILESFTNGKYYAIAEERDESDALLFIYLLHNVNNNIETVKMTLKEVSAIKDNVINIKLKGVEVLYGAPILTSQTYDTTKPNMVRKKSTKPEYSLYGFRDIYGNPKILKDEEISTAYLRSLTCADLQYIYTWINDNIFAGTMIGRLPDIPVLWRNDGGGYAMSDVVYTASTTGNNASTYDIKNQSAGVGVLVKTSAKVRFEPVAIVLNTALCTRHSANVKSKNLNTFYGALFSAMLRVAGASGSKAPKEIIALSEKIKTFLGWDIELIKKFSLIVGTRCNTINTFVAYNALTSDCFADIEEKHLTYTDENTYICKDLNINTIQDAVAAAKSAKTAFYCSVLPNYIPLMQKLKINFEKNYRRRVDVIVKTSEIKSEQGEWFDLLPFDISKWGLSNVTKGASHATAVVNKIETAMKVKGEEIYFEDVLTKYANDSNFISQIEQRVNSNIGKAVGYSDDLESIPEDFDLNRFISINPSTGEITKDDNQCAYAFWCRAVALGFKYYKETEIDGAGFDENTVAFRLKDSYYVYFLNSLYASNIFSIGDSYVSTRLHNALRPIEDLESIGVDELPDYIKDMYYVNDLYNAVYRDNVDLTCLYRTLTGLSIMYSSNLAESRGGIINNVNIYRTLVAHETGEELEYQRSLLKSYAELFKCSGVSVGDFNALYNSSLYNKYRNTSTDYALGVLDILCRVNLMQPDLSNLTYAELLLNYTQRIGAVVIASLYKANYRVDNMDVEVLNLLTQPNLLQLARLESKYHDIVIAVNR